MVPPSSPRRDRTHPHPVLAGREPERRLLRDHLAAAAAGHGQLVIVGGEAGIGKTALARDLGTAADAAGFAVVVGHCYDLSATPPYGPWLDLAARYQPAADLPVLPDCLRSDRVAAIESKAALFAAVRRFLAALTAVRPVLLVLEDLHWADPASLELLRHLCGRLHGLPVLIVVTYRVDELTRHDPFYRQLPALLRESEGTRLDLHRLDRDALRALVSARWRLAATDEARIVAYLDRHAEGNPFFALELVHVLGEDGHLQPGLDGADDTLAPLDGVVVPALLRQIIDARVARLGEDARAALALAAVIGQSAPLDLWRGVAGLDEEALLEIVERAVDAHFLDAARDGTSVRFVHALSREALYDGILPPRRRIWHRQVAEVLIAMPAPDPDAVAFHLQQASDPRAWEWLVRAGDRAQRAYAWHTAVERCAAAAALLADIPGQERTRLHLLYRSGRLRRFSEPVLGIADLVEAQRLATALDDGVLIADTTYSLGLLRCYADDFGLGLADMAAGIEALEALPPSEVGPSWRSDSWMADALPAIETGDASEIEPANAALAAVGIHHRRGTLPWFFAAAGRYTAAISEADRFVAGIGTATTGPLASSAVGHAHHGLGLAAAALGHPDAAGAALTRARARYRRLDHHAVIAFTYLTELRDVILPYHTTDIEARHHAAAAAEDALERAAGALPAGVSPRWAWLDVFLIEGRWAEIREILSESSSPGNYYLRRELTSTVAFLAHREGNPGLAWEWIHAFLPRGAATEPGGRVFIDAQILQRLAAELSLDWGDPAAAHAWLTAHDRWLAWSGAVLGQSEARIAWARYHRAVGDLGRARAIAADAVRLAQAPRRPFALLKALRLEAELALDASDLAAAAPRLEEALALAAACAAPYEHALTHIAVARHRAAGGCPAEASRALDAARRILGPLGARPALTRIDSLAAWIETEADSSSPLSGLTPRELDVLRLVAEGLTDATVAERLFISPRTVGQHLRSVYAKLGISSRSAATRFAFERQLVS